MSARAALTDSVTYAQHRFFFPILFIILKDALVPIQMLKQEMITTQMLHYVSLIQMSQSGVKDFIE